MMTKVDRVVQNARRSRVRARASWTVVPLLLAVFTATAFAAPPEIGNVQVIGQISGASAGRSTEHRWDMSATDVGTMFTDFAGNLFIAFGDSFGFVGGSGPGTPGNALHNWRPNTLARSSDNTLSNGLDLSWMSTDSPNHAAGFISNGNGDTTTIPTGGVSVGSTLYVHYQRVYGPFMDDGVWSANGSGIAVSRDYGQTWSKTNMWGANSYFVQVAFVKSGSDLYLFGTKAGRHDCMKLARVSQTDPTPTVLSSYRYWNRNTSSWVTSESSATCLRTEANADLIPVSEASVVWNSFLNKYVMMYLNENTDLMEVRTSSSLTGTWSHSALLPGYFGAYAPMLVPGQSGGQNIYFAFSLWSPYNVFLARATLNPPANPQTVTIDLPGRIEAENFREGGEGTAWHDTTIGNSGAAYTSGDVDTPWLGEDGWAVDASQGEWLAYRVNVATTGSYKLRLKYTAPGSSCRVQVDAPGGSPVYAQATKLNSTGNGPNDFAIWEPTTAFNLSAGTQFIDLYFPPGPETGCKVTWFEIIPASQGVIARIDVGVNSGSQYIDPTGVTWGYDTGFSGGTNQLIGNPISNTTYDPMYDSFRTGAMTANFPVAVGPYQVRLKFAEMLANNIGDRLFNVNIDGVRMLTDYDVLARAGGKFTAKDEVFDVYVTDGVLDLNLSNGTGGKIPILNGVEIRGGDPLMYRNYAPGHIEAENFKVGDFYDTSAGNAGGVLRNTDVDVRTKAAGGGYQVGWTANGEWIAYQVNVAASGSYHFRMRYSGGCQVQLDTDGSPVYVPATYVTNTGSPDTFATWSPTNAFNLNQGLVDINLYFPVGGCDVDYFEIY